MSIARRFLGGLGSLRVRLSIVVALALVPTLSLIAYLNVEGRRQGADEATRDAITLVRAVSADQSRLIEGTRALLPSLAHLVGITHGAGQRCDTLFAELLAGFPVYANFLAMRPTGEVFCSATPLNKPVTFADRAWFQRALTTREFVIGEPAQGRITPGIVLTIAHPVVSKTTGQVEMVINAALKLDQFARLVDLARLPPGAEVVVFDTRGTLLARHPDPASWLGRHVPDVALVRAVLAAGSEGTVETAGVDGRRRHYAYLQLPGTVGPSTLFTAIGVPREQAFARADRELARDIAFLIGAVVVALAVIWAGGDVAIVRPVRRLVATARAIGRGDLHARSGLRHAGGELGQLSRAFDEMTAALQERDRALAGAASERRLAETRTQWAAVAEASGDAIVGVTQDGTVFGWNSAAERLYGYTAAEIMGRSARILVPPERGGESREIVARLGRGEAVNGHETVLVARDGRRIDVALTVSQMTTGTGDRSGLSIVARDVTEQRRAEEQRRVVSAALGAAANGIVITDHEGRIEWVNPAFTAMTGYELDDVISRTPRVLKSGHHDAAFYTGLWDTIRAGRVWRGEMVNRRKDGSFYDEEQTITPVLDDRGVTAHFVAIKQDITQRREAERAEENQRRLERQLAQSEKLAAMGELLAGVAHELNNPLSVVIGQTVLLQRTAEPASAQRGEKIARAAERCGRIVKNFLALARHYAPERKPVVLNQLVRDTLEMIAYQLRVNDIETIDDLATDVPVVWADPHQIQQVLVNLVTNATQAMSEAPRPRRLSIVTRGEGAGVALEVIDNGPGIPPEVERRLFEPFFTTKPVGQGTGLGLSICKGIVESHGGRIAVEGRPGVGAARARSRPARCPRDSASWSWRTSRLSPASSSTCSPAMATGSIRPPTGWTPSSGCRTAGGTRWSAT
jgi:PAS domain S-box-containing protein